MSTFSYDPKWLESKKVIGDLNWLEVVSYYRMIGGKNVFVYSVIDGETRLIVDVMDDGKVLLVNRSGDLELSGYDEVMNSRKIFKYSNNIKEKYYKLGEFKIKIPIESRE